MEFMTSRKWEETKHRKPLMGVDEASLSHQQQQKQPLVKTREEGPKPTSQSRKYLAYVCSTTNTPCNEELQEKERRPWKEETCEASAALRVGEQDHRTCRTCGDGKGSAKICQGED